MFMTTCSVFCKYDNQKKTVASFVEEEGRGKGEGSSSLYSVSAVEIV